MGIALLVSFIVAVLFWTLHEVFFISPFNRVSRIFSGLAVFVPFLGPLYQIGVFIAYCSSYRSYYGNYEFDKNGKQVLDIDNDIDHSVVRDTPVARWLFNELNWERIDGCKREAMSKG